ncbi:MAG: ribonuclease P protein subunit [Thaumarchaeota archaeon]|nr:ribonuclease P protein subunit [Nitrososphaerota archaeon]
MNVIGERLTVLKSADPSKRGVSGLVVLETARTLVLDSGKKAVRIEKEGSAFQVSGSKTVILGSDIRGRLEDRWGSKPR